MRAENKEQIVSVGPSYVAGSGKSPGTNFSLPRARNLFWMLAALSLCFSLPLYHLAKFAVGSDLYSYILVMPLVTIYLLWPKRMSLWNDATPARGLAAAFGFGGLLVLLGYGLAVRSGWKLAVEDQFTFTISSFFLLLCGVFCFSLGRSALRTIALPVGLLVFMVPVPVFVMSRIETFLQYGSAWVADWMFKCAFTPHLLSGLDFALPGTPGLRVAPECSGIHSTWILLITSLLAGYLFLRSPSKRAVLVLAVIPLALLRNGFRVFTLGELSVHIGPQILDTPIHHQGGPIFFALSLIPFFLLLAWLHRSGGARGKADSNLSVN